MNGPLTFDDYKFLVANRNLVGINNETSQLANKKNFDCNLELEDHLTLQAKIQDKENIEKTINKNLDFIPISKLVLCSFIFLEFILISPYKFGSMSKLPPVITKPSKKLVRFSITEL